MKPADTKRCDFCDAAITVGMRGACVHYLLAQAMFIRYNLPFPKETRAVLIACMQCNRMLTNSMPQYYEFVAPSLITKHGREPIVE